MFVFAYVFFKHMEMKLKTDFAACKITQLQKILLWLTAHYNIDKNLLARPDCSETRVLLNYVPCFCRVIETQTQVDVCENEKCCGNTNRTEYFQPLFRVLPNFKECFFNSIETRRTFFLFFFLENTATKKGKKLVNIDY